MTVKIRLTRTGRKNLPSYRVVVADSRMPRDGRFLDTIGHYDPKTDPSVVEIDKEKAKAWLGKGAQPSNTVARLLEISGVLEAKKKPAKPAKATPTKAAKKSAAKQPEESPEAPADEKTEE